MKSKLMNFLRETLIPKLRHQVPLSKTLFQDDQVGQEEDQFDILKMSETTSGTP